MSDRINDFLDKICASVKYRTMHSEIREQHAAGSAFESGIKCSRAMN